MSRVGDVVGRCVFILWVGRGVGLCVGGVFFLVGCKDGAAVGDSVSDAGLVAACFDSVGSIDSMLITDGLGVGDSPVPSTSAVGSEVVSSPTSSTVGAPVGTAPTVNPDADPNPSSASSVGIAVGSAVSSSPSSVGAGVGATSSVGAAVGVSSAPPSCNWRPSLRRMLAAAAIRSTASARNIFRCMMMPASLVLSEGLGAFAQCIRFQ
mmetsp:Transcript_8620/g.23275  ORF Transcript_8620/g.23275 Transcript_8620/m.23275 type:complete len:208 (+) Transcript_8620:1131-1754(+)